MKKIILILAFCAFLPGCAAALLTPIIGGAGALIEGGTLIAKGITTWQDQEATTYYKADINTVYRAVNHTAKALNLTVTSDDQNKNGKGYHLNLSEATGNVVTKDRFKITIATENSLTVVKIRILFKDDKPYVDFIYTTITNNINNIIQFQNGKPVKFHLLRRNQ